MARRLTTLTHGGPRSDGGGALARVPREPRSGSVSRVGWSGPPFEDGDDLVELQTSGLRQVPGGERDRQHREAGASHHHPRQPAPRFKVGKASMITKSANQSTLAQIAAARPRTPVGKYSPWISLPVPPTPLAKEVIKKKKRP